MAHEYAHAATALRQGDDTAYMLGRVTMNPVSHIDPWMTLILPILLLWVSQGRFTFGGAKPVPITPRKFRHYVRGDLLVSSAGVAANLGIAICCALAFTALHYLAVLAPGLADLFAIVQRMMMWGVWLNLLLCFFNLIPIPPLDGSHLLYHALPAGLGARYRQLGRFGYVPLFILLFLGQPVLNFLLTPMRLGMDLFLRLVAPFGIGEAWRILS